MTEPICLARDSWMSTITTHSLDAQLHLHLCSCTLPQKYTSRPPLEVAFVSDPALLPGIELFAALLRRICEIRLQQDGIVPRQGIARVVCADSHLEVIAGVPPRVADDRGQRLRQAILTVVQPLPGVAPQLVVPHVPQILQGGSEAGFVAVSRVRHRFAAVNDVVDSHLTAPPILGRAGHVILCGARGGGGGEGCARRKGGEGCARGQRRTHRRPHRRPPLEARLLIPAFCVATFIVVVESVHPILRRHLKLVNAEAGGVLQVEYRGWCGSRRGAPPRLPGEAIRGIAAG